MDRHYYISDDLNDLEIIEKELKSKGVTTHQIHILSQDHAGVEKHKLHAVPSFMKKNVVRSTCKAAVFGVIIAVIILAVPNMLGWVEKVTWVPFVFLAIVMMGFITWEGGMWGIQKPNARFMRFQGDLDAGKHVLYVDIRASQEAALKSVVEEHTQLQAVGTEQAPTGLLIGVENSIHRFVKWAP